MLIEQTHLRQMDELKKKTFKIEQKIEKNDTILHINLQLASSSTKWFECDWILIQFFGATRCGRPFDSIWLLWNKTVCFESAMDMKDPETTGGNKWNVNYSKNRSVRNGDKIKASIAIEKAKKISVIIIGLPIYAVCIQTHCRIIHQVDSIANWIYFAPFKLKMTIAIFTSCNLLCTL